MQHFNVTGNYIHHAFKWKLYINQLKVNEEYRGLTQQMQQLYNVCNPVQQCKVFCVASYLQVLLLLYTMPFDMVRGHVVQTSLVQAYWSHYERGQDGRLGQQSRGLLTFSNQQSTRVSFNHILSLTSTKYSVKFILDLGNKVKQNNLNSRSKYWLFWELNVNLNQVVFVP